MTEEEVKMHEDAISCWSKEVNPSRRALALKLVDEIRRLKKELERVYGGLEAGGP